MKTCLLLVLGVTLFVSTFAASSESSEEKEKPEDAKHRPSFLEGADEKNVEEFRALLQKSGDLTDDQIDAAVDDWVDKQGDSIKVCSVLQYFLINIV